MSRAAGILMPITSLPSPYGIGTIGKEAYKFADFLKKSGQTIWQILPVGPTSYGDSPYQSFSTYAGNPYMIDLEMLIEDGLLQYSDMDGYNYGTNPGYVDYEKIYNCRFEILRKAYENFKLTDKDSEQQKAFRSFKRKNSAWLKNYALYMSVKKSFDMKSWTEWDDESIRLRDEKAVARYTRKFSDEIGFWSFIQFKFYEQWEKFRAYVNSLGIKILGDMPIYVAMDSADTWANPEVFWLDESRNPVCVAGCPPDYFSATGQLWGNPLYNWDYLKETGYKWWFERIKAATALFDITRIDHFRAFDTYYAIPFPAENAIGGSWKEGPGIEFFNLMNEQIENVEIVAEDLGDLTPGVKQLLLDCGYPGMKILEFAFGGDNDNEYLPHLYPENCVVYTGTHDNDTVMGWRSEADDNTLRHAYEYCHLSDEEGFNWGIIRTAYESRAKYAIIPMQDLLGLGSEARINTPSTLGGNWEWRIDAASLTDELAAKLMGMVNTYNR